MLHFFPLITSRQGEFGISRAACVVRLASECPTARSCLMRLSTQLGAKLMQLPVMANLGLVDSALTSRPARLLCPDTNPSVASLARATVSPYGSGVGLGFSSSSFLSHDFVKYRIGYWTPWQVNRRGFHSRMMARRNLSLGSSTLRLLTTRNEHSRGGWTGAAAAEGNAESASPESADVERRRKPQLPAGRRVGGRGGSKLVTQSVYYKAGDGQSGRIDDLKRVSEGSYERRSRERPLPDNYASSRSSRESSRFAERSFRQGVVTRERSPWRDGGKEQEAWYEGSGEDAFKTPNWTRNSEQKLIDERILTPWELPKNKGPVQVPDAFTGTSQRKQISQGPKAPNEGASKGTTREWQEEDQTGELPSWLAAGGAEASYDEEGAKFGSLHDSEELEAELSRSQPRLSLNLDPIRGYSADSFVDIRRSSRAASSAKQSTSRTATTTTASSFPGSIPRHSMLTPSNRGAPEVSPGSSHLPFSSRAGREESEQEVGSSTVSDADVRSINQVSDSSGEDAGSVGTSSSSGGGGGGGGSGIGDSGRSRSESGIWSTAAGSRSSLQSTRDASSSEDIESGRSLYFPESTDFKTKRKKQKDLKKLKEPIPPPEGNPNIAPMDPAPFEFQFSYTETPNAPILGYREPPFSPFGPTTMSRPWTGGPPLRKSKKNALPRLRPEFDSFVLPENRKKGMKPVHAPGPFPEGQAPAYVRTREEVLGAPLTREEVRELMEECLKDNKRPGHLPRTRQVHLGRDGLVHNMLELVHAHWKRRRVCRIKCIGVPTVDMDNVCRVVEEKTGGIIIHRAGGVLYVFRGRNYNWKLRPRLPLMLWKPPAPIYPKLIQDAPAGLTVKEAEELRKEGRRIKPLCQLTKNGVYIDLVPRVRKAFQSSHLVKLNCKGMNPSDYKKIAAKLKELVPCVLLSFEKEQVLMWKAPGENEEHDEKESETEPLESSIFDDDETSGLLFVNEKFDSASHDDGHVQEHQIFKDEDGTFDDGASDTYERLVDASKSDVLRDSGASGGEALDEAKQEIVDTLEHKDEEVDEFEKLWNEALTSGNMIPITEEKSPDSKGM